MNDPTIYRMVVAFLGAATLLVVIGCATLAGMHVDPPQALIAMGSAAVGALAGLLAPSPIQKP